MTVYADFIRLVGPSGYSPNGVLASIPASGVMYVRCPAGLAVEKLDWLLQGNRNHGYQFFRCEEIPASLATVTISGWLNTETILIMGQTYTGATSTTTWSTNGISIAGADDVDAGLLQKAINGGKVVTCASVQAGDTVTVNGKVYTAHATTTTVANREFAMNGGTNALVAAELATCLSNGTYGNTECTTTQGAATGEVLIATTADPDTYPTVTSSTSRLAVSSIGQTYIYAERSSNVLTLKWRASLVNRYVRKAPFFYTGKTGTATTHAAFTDELLKSLQEEAAAVTGKTDNSTKAGAIYTQTLNGAPDGYLAVTNSDGSNPMITRVAAYRVPF